MRRDLIYAGQWFITVLIPAIGLSAYGCKDSVSFSDKIQVPLSSLTITPGTLQPVFSSNTTSYTVDVSTTVTSITVMASPKESTTMMTINKVVTKPGQGYPVSLSPAGTTTDITIVLTNQNGIESTYDIAVHKVDNNLSALTVTPPGAFPPPGFIPSTLDYAVDVASTVDSVAVSATKVDPRAAMSGAVNAGAGVATGAATIPLNEPGTATLVSITVAVLNGETKAYRITVNRLSGDNNLSALSVTPPGTFPPPGFVPSTTAYTVDVPSDVDKVTISATKSDPNAAMSDSVTAGPGTASGTATLNLGGQGTSTDFFITVAAPDPTVPHKEYHITVNRAAPSSNANLSALIVNAGLLNQPIDLNTPPYRVNVASEVVAVTVTATLEDTNATMTINEQGTLSDVPSQVIFLGNPGSDTTIIIEVRAQNTVDTKTYTVTVHREDPGPPPPP